MTGLGLRSEAQEQIDANGLPQFGFEVIESFPHDTGAFTQGLIFENGYLYESTGLEGRSSLRQVEISTGNIVRKVDLDKQYFGEGMTLFRDKMYQLTWKAEKGFVYNPQTFDRIGDFQYSGEGWGLTHDEHSLILSDGTDVIRFLDSEGFQVKKMIKVKAGGKPVTEINELEFINGEIYANIWQTDYIVRIDPSSGNVKSVVDLTGLLPDADRTAHTNVLNGIAYDPAGDRLFVTGKLWPKIFEIKLKPKQNKTIAAG